MKDIKIIVTKKVASVEGTPIIVCGNSDYTLSFTFDDEWSNEQNKVARFSFIKNGLKSFIDVPIHDNTCQVPVLIGIGLVRVGAYAGDLKTTTGAKIKCHKSILCDDADTMDEPFKNLYENLKGEIAEAKEDTDKALADLEKGVMKKEDVLNSKRDPTNEYQVYSAEVITELVWELVSLLGEKADKTALDELKTEIQGELDEIGDLVGGEDSGTGEVIPLIETAEYEFTSNAPEGWCATNIYLDNVPDDILSQTFKLTIGDMVEEFTMVDNPNTDSVSYVAGNGLVLGNGDTSENYIINIAIIDTESGQWGCSLFYRATAGTYPVSLSYKAVE